MRCERLGTYHYCYDARGTDFEEREMPLFYHTPTNLVLPPPSGRVGPGGWAWPRRWFRNILMMVLGPRRLWWWRGVRRLDCPMMVYRRLNLDGSRNQTARPVRAGDDRICGAVDARRRGGRGICRTGWGRPRPVGQHGVRHRSSFDYTVLNGRFRERRSRQQGIRFKFLGG